MSTPNVTPIMSLDEAIAAMERLTRGISYTADLALQARPGSRARDDYTCEVLADLDELVDATADARKGIEALP